MYKAIDIKLQLKGLLASIRDAVGTKGRYYEFGAKDNFPNIIIDAVNDSGTARECIDKRKIFLTGEGIKNKSFAKSMANPEQTWEQLLDDIILQLAHVPCVSLQVKYNRAGEPARFYWIPFQHLRKRHHGDFIYNPALGDPPGYHYTMNRSQDKIIPAFGSCSSPKAIRNMVADQIDQHGEQLGEILYIYEKGMGVNYEHYPVPKWSAGLHDINADAGLSLHEEAQVSNSFKAGVVIATRKMDHVTKDGNGKTEFDYYQDEIDSFCSPDGSPVLTIEGVNEEGSPMVTPLNIQHQMDATEKATDRIARKVCRLMSVPPIIIGIQTAGKLGDNQELVNYMKLFHLSLSQSWKLVYQAMERLFPKMSRADFEFIPLNLFDFIPDKVIDKMTPAQINEIYDLPNDPAVQMAPDPSSPQAAESAEEIKVNEHLKNITGKQQQQLERINRKFSRDQLTDQQAIFQLVSSFGLTEGEAKKYLNIEEEIDHESDN